MTCYRHDYRGMEPCPGDHAYEGDREYFNAKIAKLQDQIGILHKLYDGLVEAFYEYSGVWVNLEDSLMRSTPQEGSTTTEPTPDPDDGFQGLRKLAKEEMTHRRPK